MSIEDKKFTPITREFLETVYKGDHRPERIVKYVFWFLRNNMYLTEQEDYKRLYEEALDFQIGEAIAHCDWKPEEVEENRRDMEFCADMFSAHPSEAYKSFNKMKLDMFLEFRRRYAWSR